LRVPAVTKQYAESVCPGFQELRDIVGCIKDAFLEGCPGRIELSCRIYRVSKEGFILGSWRESFDFLVFWFIPVDLKLIISYPTYVQSSGRHRSGELKLFAQLIHPDLVRANPFALKLQN